MRGAIYTRVSTDMQVDGYSLDAQLEACQALAQSRGWEVVKVYTDEGVSAKTTNRPRFQELMRDARAGLFDVVIVHKLDRLSRSVADVLTTLQSLEKMGIAFVSATEQFDFTTPIGRVFLTLLAAFAQWYLDNLSMETAKGKKARAQAGLWNSAVPFGYRVTYKKDGGDGLAYPDEKDAEGVRQAFERYATGHYSDYDIAVWLNQAGYRPKGRGRRALSLFSKDTVTDMLQNRFYLGEVCYKGEWYEGVHEAIITEELFNRVQAARRARAANTAVKARKGSRVYILSGIAYCARCKNRMRGWSTTGYRYYSDQARNRMVNCDQKSIRADEAEAALGDYLRRFQLPQDWRNQILQMVQAETGRAEEIKREREALTRRLNRLKDLYLLGDVSLSEYKSQKQQIESQIDRLTPPVLPDLEEAAAILENFGVLWDAATPKERKRIAQTLLQAVYLDSGECGPIIAIQPKAEFAKLFEFFTSDGDNKPVAPV